MIRISMLFAAMGLFACNGGGKEGEDTDGTDADDVDDEEDCDNGIVFPTHPEDGADDAYYRTTVEVTFQEADSSATLVLKDSADAEVAGATAWNGDTLVFTPSAPLSPLTEYTAHIAYECATDATISFTTSEVGTTATCDVGTAFVLDITSGRFVEPAGVGPLLQQQLTVDILLGITSISDTELNMIGAISQEGLSEPTQDLCTETIPFPAADFTGNPYFQLGSGDAAETTTISVAGYSVDIQALKVTGAFSPDCSYMAGATLSGSVDTRPLVPLLDEEGDDNTICALVQTFGVSCVDCASDGEPYCLNLAVDSITAIEEEGLLLEERTADDVANDPTCAE